ncbi:putative histidine kinase [uncultured Thiomicrorhabdus sp.]
MRFLRIKNLRQRITVITAITALIFSFLFWLLIYVAEDMMELISLHNWLESESKSYQLSDYQRVPNPLEFDLFTADDRLPQWLSQYRKPGFYEHQLGPEDKHFLVSINSNSKQPYYIVFKDDADDYLDAYEERLQWVSGLLGVFAMLLILGYSLWVLHIFRASLRGIENKIDCLPPDKPAFKVESNLDDIRQLEEQLVAAKNTILLSIQREREFNQFAAHEIRSPLTVIQGSAELLTELLPTDSKNRQISQRITGASQELKQLVNALLLLGQTELDEHHIQRIDITEVLTAVIAKLPEPYAKRVELHKVSPIYVEAPESFLIMIFKNLIQNAMTHTDRSLLIKVDEEGILFSNPLQSSVHSAESFGYGLIIVERICHKMGWTFTKTQANNRFSLQLGFS